MDKKYKRYSTYNFFKETNDIYDYIAYELQAERAAKRLKEVYIAHIVCNKSNYLENQKLKNL